MSKGSEPAFPTPERLVMRGVGHGIRCEGGLTKRELFAAMMVQAAIHCGHDLDDEPRTKHQLIARDAVRMADALIAELEKEK